MPALEDLSTRDRALAAAVGEVLAEMRAAAGIGFQPGKVAVEMREVHGQAGGWEVFLTDWNSDVEIGVMGRFRMSDIHERADQLVAEQN